MARIYNFFLALFRAAAVFNYLIGIGLGLVRCYVLGKFMVRIGVRIRLGWWLMLGLWLGKRLW